MKLSIQQIAEIIGAEADPQIKGAIFGVNSFHEAGENEITFAGDLKYLNKIQACRASAVIIPKPIDPQGIKGAKSVILAVDNPKRAFFDLVEIFHPNEKRIPAIHSSAFIGKDVSIGQYVTIEPGAVICDEVSVSDDCHIMANVYIGKGCTIGSHTLVKPNVTIHDRSKIGNHVIIHSGSVIGSDGFGFTQDSNSHHKIMHTGIVEIGDHVEIGACNTIDRGTLGKTIIGHGVKTDNLVHIAHNVKIGDNSLIVAQVGIAGSATLGKNVIVAGKAGISGHIKIGDNTIIGPYAGVHANIDSGQIVSGVPQMPHRLWRKVTATIPRLPELRKKVLSFEKRLRQLEEKLLPTEKK